MTVAALLAFALAQVWNIPLHGLWAVLTAVVLTQISVGGSLHATTEYVLGTMGGAVYAAAIAVLIPHTTELALAGVLALTIAPLAFAAAVSPSFRVAPFTAAIVLLIWRPARRRSGQIGALSLLEVASAAASRSSFRSWSCRNGRMGSALTAAARILDLLARAPSQAAGRIHAEARCRRGNTHAARGRVRSCRLPGDCGRGQG